MDSASNQTNINSIVPPANGPSKPPPQPPPLNSSTPASVNQSRENPPSNQTSVPVNILNTSSAPLPLAAAPNPVSVHVDKKPDTRKIPVLVILLFASVSILGFGGSFFYYATAGQPKPVKLTSLVPTKIPQPSPTSLPKVAVNPFITPTISFRKFFATAAEAYYENPFEETNPFGEMTNENTDNQSYQNPFESLR